MKTQTKLSELDATKLANLRLRQQLLNNEDQAFAAQLMATYANPDEDIGIGLDNSIIRTPRPPVVAPRPPKGKGKPKA